MVFGWEASGRPPFSLGYVNFPAVLILGSITVLTAPFGARLAHRMSRTLLRKTFALYLLVTAASVLIKAL